MTYIAPLAEQIFALQISGNLDSYASLAGSDGIDAELVAAILGEAAKFAENIFAPLNAVGDTQGASIEDGRVELPDGFRNAYDQYVDAGWTSLALPAEIGGQALPHLLAAIAGEQLASANMAFSLCMMLSQGAILTLAAHASPELRQRFLPKLVSGQWSGTMNLTEPQAGSDLAQIKTRAQPQSDGSYKLSGSKIYITWGEHDLAENIIHLVLARMPGAPPGSKGISLFLAPKYLPDADGACTIRNDLRCASIEHKLGIHASPTCTMIFGDADNCQAWLVGEANAGLKAMFTMMNHARINVGLQGVAIAEAAYQHAFDYARERVQSVPFGAADPHNVPIIAHADVRRMLMTMKAYTQASRAIAYFNMAAVDRAHLSLRAEERAAAQGRADLVTPITKAFATDIGVEVASLAIQVFGGMGYVEETGAARYYRDARIAPIYEGTNGIQAIDLVGRKLSMHNGRDFYALDADLRRIIHDLPGAGYWGEICLALTAAVDILKHTTDWLRAQDAWDKAAGATPYLRLFGLTLGATLLAEQAAAAQQRLSRAEGDPGFLESKIATARFFVTQLLPQNTGLAAAITAGGDLTRAESAGLFG